MSLAQRIASAATAFGLVAAVPAAPALAGHAGVDIITQTNRVIARVTGVGAPNDAGAILSFDIDVTGLVTNEIRSWRVTFVSGEIFAYVFQVRTNTSSNGVTTVEVTSLDGPLNGIAVGDGLLIEDLPTRRPTPQMRPPA